MALNVQVTIKGTVGPEVAQVLINGTAATLTGRNYQGTVAASTGIVAITTIDAAGRESVRTIQLAATAGAPA